ncbi:MAG: phenylalanine--tRNA ligase subunit beta, partial [Actinomycetota bacterium]|nr:phenylalanine--tRNA ligase subunit beta [Actinomycetota bacterium]
VSLNWLRDYVPVEVPVAELVDLLNFSGTKVDSIQRAGRDIAGVVAARVLAIEPHPDADNLTLVEIDAGGDLSERVVCGATNFAVGDLVPFAQVGAHLPDMEITERKIRGQMSWGMLCSGRELGVSKDHSGILVLSPDAAVGDDVTKLLGMNDTIIEFEITPNRPDCMGMIGIAREVAAVTGEHMTLPDIQRPVGGSPSPPSVELEDPTGCPRYVATSIEEVSVAPSPGWLAARLIAAGLRPISNVVDVTNYVMMEIGHPLHPFDAAKVAQHKIVVRRARSGEEMTTLDGVRRLLGEDDLVIADPDRPLALAGVMGGADSEVSPDTSEVILEAAYFDPASIARTSRRHGLRSEASARFERGMDPAIPPSAAARAAALITQVAGNAVAGDPADVYPAPIERPRISLRPHRTDAVLGAAVPPARQAALLRAVEFIVVEAAGSLEVVPPSFRPDIGREVDLIEEVARLSGLDKLPSTLPPGRVGGLDTGQTLDRLVRRTLAGLGLREAWTSTFMSPADLDSLRLPAGHAARRTLVVANPMSEEEKLLRTTLLPGLLRAASRNLSRTPAGVALFESAHIYEPQGEPLPREPAMVGGVFEGNRHEAGWNAPVRKWDFFAVKGIVEALLDSLRLPAAHFAPHAEMPFHPSRAAHLSLAETPLGVLGEIHPEVCVAFGLPEGTVAFEIATAPILAALPGRPSAGEVGRFPAVFLDLAVVVDASQRAGEIEDAIRSAGAPEAIAVRLFDVYSGPQVPEGKKSLAYSLQLRVPERTLTEEDAAVVRDRILDELERRFGARLRT